MTACLIYLLLDAAYEIYRESANCEIAETYAIVWQNCYVVFSCHDEYMQSNLIGNWLKI